MPEDFTLHSKYTGDESHGVKVVPNALQVKNQDFGELYGYM